MNPKQRVLAFLYHALRRRELALLQGHESGHKAELLAEVQAKMAELSGQYQAAGELPPPPPPPPPPPDDDF